MTRCQSCCKEIVSCSATCLQGHSRVQTSAEPPSSWGKASGFPFVSVQHRSSLLHCNQAVFTETTPLISKPKLQVDSICSGFFVFLSQVPPQKTIDQEGLIRLLLDPRCYVSHSCVTSMR